MVFWFLFFVDAAAALVVVYFFFVGLIDGSVSSFNGGLWAGTLGAVAAILGLGWLLRAKAQRAAAHIVLSVLAVPALLYGAFVLMIVIAQPSWR